MKRISFLIAAILLLATTLQAQWIQTNPPPMAGSFNILDATPDYLSIESNGSGGNYRSSDNGNTWISITGDLPQPTAVLLGDFGNTLYSSWVGTVHKSTNGGVNWTSISAGLPSSDIAKGFTALSKDSLFVGYTAGRVYASIDSGNTWTNISAGLPSSVDINQLKVSSNYLLAATTDTRDSLTGGIYYAFGGVYYRPLSGGTWQLAAAPYGPIPIPVQVKRISVYYPTRHPISAGSSSLFAIYDFVDQFGNDLYVLYKSTNNGKNWTYVSRQTIVTIRSVLALSDSLLIGGGQDNPVFRSTDGGINWQLFSEGLAGNFPSSFAANNEYIFMTSSSATWRRPLSQVLSTPLAQSQPQQFELRQNYPNPFNPSTTIAYETKSVSNVSIKVYDLLGKEISTLVNERKPAGNYQVAFNANNLSSGTYFYRLQAGDFVQTKRMTLVK